MPSLVQRDGNSLGDVRRYLAGTGNLMLAGAVGFTYALRSFQGEQGFVVTAVCVLAAAVIGLQGLAAMRDFVRSAPNRILAASLATATFPFSLLGGGLFGAVLISVISDVIFA